MKSLLLLMAVVSLSLISGCALIKSRKSANAEEAVVMPAICRQSICRIKVEGYPHDIAVMVPPKADWKQVTFFFHGFSFNQRRDKNIDAIIDDFDVIGAFEKSLSNRILIMPFSSGKNRDYRQHFKGKEDLQIFLAKVYKTFNMKAVFEDVHLVGHSGAHLTIQNIVGDQKTLVQNFKISQVTLLDATYSSFSPSIFNRWLEGGNAKMTIIYLKNSPTQKKALEMWNIYSKDKPGPIGGFNLEGGNYLTVIPESEVGRANEAHWLLVRKWLPRVL
jgi:hypothetical protein